MSAHWKRIFHTCLAILLLSSCAAAPVLPTAGQPRPTLTARPSAHTLRANRGRGCHG